MRIKISTPSLKLIQDNVFLMTFGVITNGKAYNTLSYYKISDYTFGTIVKHIKRCM